MCVRVRPRGGGRSTAQRVGPRSSIGVRVVMCVCVWTQAIVSSLALNHGEAVKSLFISAVPYDMTHER